MIFSHVAITNFRNIKRLTFSPDAGMNLFIGRNGQGKSNLLEALDFISTGRSFRTSKEGELIAWNQDFARIESEFTAGDDVSVITLALVREGEHIRKKLQMNGTVIKRLSQFLGKIKSVSFSRNDLETVAGPPHFRRQFLDHILSMVNTQYLFTLQRYSAILKERNNWLRSSFPPGRPHDPICEVWKEQLAHYGSLIVKERMETIAHLGIIAAEIFGALSSESGSFSLRYLPSFPVDSSDCQVIFQRFIHYLEKYQKSEEERKTTLIGPHRDDLLLKLENKHLRTFGSQGQQRFAAIILKLSESHFIEEKSGVLPIILLDDCFSELDLVARRGIWAFLRNKGQVFMTSNSLPLEEGSEGDCTLYQIVEGNVAHHVQKS
jgi:DNA replication and repair protein RecF